MAAKLRNRNRKIVMKYMMGRYDIELMQLKLKAS